MPDFSELKYASYVQLCRELHTEGHDFTFGDWYWYEGIHPAPEYDHDLSIWTWGQRSKGFGPSEPQGVRRLWLPSLADWLEMLEATGCRIWVVASDPEGGWQVGNGWGLNGAVAPTYEEAAARLWMVVGHHIQSLPLIQS